MTFVRTVLGDIAPAELGVCYAHEHVIIAPSFVTQIAPEFLLDNLDHATAELRQFYADGGRAMVDSMPCDAGRSVEMLAELSRRTRVHLVCPTGLHLAKYYPPGHWGDLYNEDELAELFTAEITQGVDARDCGGPVARRTPHRAGVIKIATGKTVTGREKKIFAAAAAAHRRTGCPILTHTEEGDGALEQIAMLRSGGVDLRHVCFSHTDRKPDLAYHREVLSSGVRLEFDSAFRWKTAPKNPTRDLLLALLPEFPNQLMLGMDAARRSYWRTYGGAPGLSFLLREFSAELRAHGVTDAMLECIFLTTPAATFSFAASSSRS